MYVCFFLVTLTMPENAVVKFSNNYAFHCNPLLQVRDIDTDVECRDNTEQGYRCRNKYSREYTG